MGEGISLGSFPLLGKSSASLGRVGWGVLGDQWRVMAFRKSHKYCTVSTVPKVSWLTVFGKGNELKNWMFEQLVNNKGRSSTQFLLREFYLEYKRVLLLFFFYARKIHFLKYKNYFAEWIFFIFWSLCLKVSQLAAYITTSYGINECM